MIDNSEDYIRIAVQIVGIGEYGSSVISKLKQDNIINVKYHNIDFGNRHIKRTKEFLHEADVVFIIADINSKSVLKTVSEAVGISKEKSNITVLLMSDSCLHNEIGNPDNLLIKSFMEISDTLFIVSDQISSFECMKENFEYKQIYSCVKALTDICGDRMGLINTGLGDIINSIRKGGIGYIGFGEAKGENAISEATDSAIQKLTKYSKLKSANDVIATISYNNCSIENILPFYEKIEHEMSEEATFNYNIYLNNNDNDLCSVVILTMGYK